MKRLLFGAPKKLAVHPLEAGDLCMALPAAEQRAANEDDKRYLATVVNHSKRLVVFFDDGSETQVVVSSVDVATVADREAAKAVYSAALDECKRVAAREAADVVSEAIEKVRSEMGGTLGSDQMISYTDAAGAEAKEGQLLCQNLIASLGSIGAQSPALRWMQSQWQDVCKQHDADQSGTISEDEAASIWDQVKMTVFNVIAAKLDILGAPPRLYRGDLCLAQPAEAAATGDASSSPTSGRDLATYVDSTHVSFFDGAGDAVSATGIVPATPAAKEQAILRYTMALSQLKSIARKPSKEVVKAAIDKVRVGMGGTLGANAAINYTQDAGDESREGQLLCAALVEHLSVLKAQSRAAASIASNWQVCCAQADEDGSGTISTKEAIAIWDRILIETTRACAAKLDKLGVEPLPLILEKGDFCMVRPIPSEASSGDPERLYLATYVDPTHAIFFDDGDEEVHEIARVGPATEADKDVAIVKYMTALDQCTRLAGFDEEDVVDEAIEEVKAQMGGSLGANGHIDYRETAGDEAKEGQLLVEALMTNVGALWDESRSLRYMKQHWRQICKEVDTDESGTISEDEVAEIWDRVLVAFRQAMLAKLEQLGVVQKSVAKIATVAKTAAAEQSQAASSGTLDAVDA